MWTSSCFRALRRLLIFRTNRWGHLHSALSISCLTRDIGNRVTTHHILACGNMFRLLGVAVVMLTLTFKFGLLTALECLDCH